MNQILVLEKNIPAFRSVLERVDLTNATIHYAQNAAEAAPALAQAQILFGSPALIIPLLPQLPRLRWVQSSWAGIAPFMQAGVRQDYTLTNVKGIFGEYIAEYTLAYILAHEKNLLAHVASQQEKRWNPLRPGRLRGKRLGILGVGSIGLEVAQIAKGLGLTVWGLSRSRHQGGVLDRHFLPDGLPELAAGVDYLLNTLPNTPATESLLNRAIFQTMRPSALLINIGRGTAVVDDDLAEALEQKEIAGAVLDVFRTEPLPVAHRFWTTPNLHITSHTAAPTDAADAVEIFVDNYGRFVSGQPLNFVIDFERGY